MTMTILMMLSIFLSLSFIMLIHPLSMGVILLLQTLIITMKSGFMNSSFWYSYIMFLIMVGGMMVLFIYMTSVASNEKFKFSKSILSLWLIILPITLIPVWLNIPMVLPSWNQESMKMIYYSSNESMTKFINQPSNFLLFMTIIYLLVTMIAVVKIANSKKGALRQKS
uniref:NADH-ubiquinone oxidoreductase chain 6 n=1 Tax=Trogoderma variabile TaxID=888089 RepID=A0A7D5TXN8_9COLE